MDGRPRELGKPQEIRHSPRHHWRSIALVQGCGPTKTCAWCGHALAPRHLQQPMQSTGGVDGRTARTRRRPHATEGVPGRVLLGRGSRACRVTPAQLLPMIVMLGHNLLRLSAPRTLFRLFSQEHSRCRTQLRWLRFLHACTSLPRAVSLLHAR